jgi:hypothetical protein
MLVTAQTPYGEQTIEVRFVILSPTGGFFTEMKESGKRNVMANGAVVAEELLYLPQFEAMRPRFASQFDTEADAAIVMADSRFGAPESFAGCLVVPSTQE